MPRDQCGDGEGESHREADVTHVQHGRVNDEPGVLQQGVEVAPFRGAGQQALEGVGSEQDEEQEAGSDEAQHGDDAGDHGVGQRTGKHGDGQRPQAEHDHPQQQRTFVTSPHGGDLVLERQVRVGVLRHVGYGKIVLHEGDREADKGGQQHQGERAGGWTRQRNPARTTELGAEERQYALDQCNAQGKNKGKMAKFGNHRESCSRAIY